MASIDTYPPSITNSSSASFTISGVDTGGGVVEFYQCRIDGGTWSACGTNPSLGGLASGAHTFDVRAVDSASNISNTTSYNWFIDNTVPTISIGVQPQAITNSQTATFNFSASDTGGGSISSTVCSIDGGAFSSCSSGVSFTALAAGSHTFQVKALDTAGNESLVASVSWTIDLTAPIVTIVSKPNSVTNSTSATITFSATDSGGGTVVTFSCSLDGGSFATCVSPRSWTGLSAGNHTVAIRALDSAGNLSVSTSYSWIIDTTPPSVAITSPAAGTFVTTINRNSFTISGTCSEVGLDVTVSGAASASVNCSSAGGGTWTANLDLSLPSDGSVTVTASQTDQAGNTASSVPRNFIKDTIYPVIAITPPVALKGGASSTAIPFTLTELNATSANSFTVEIFNGAVWSSLGTMNSISGNNNLAAYSLNSYTVPVVNVTNARIRISYTDAAGYTATQTSGTFIIDSTPPVISSFVLANGATDVALPFINITLSASDNLSAITHMQLSETTPVGTDWITYSTSNNFSLSKVNGPKIVYLWVRDAVGNISAVSQRGIKLDFGSPPVVSISSPVSGEIYIWGQAVPISWSCSSTNGLDENAPISLIQYTIDDGANYCPIVSNLPDGTGTYSGWSIPTADCKGVSTSSKAFRIMITCKSKAGVATNANSQIFNTPGWSIFAGDPWYATKDVNASNAIVSPNSNTTSSLTADPQGNIYYVYNHSIMKLDAGNGLVTQYAGSLTNGGCTLGTSGVTLLNGRLSSPTILGMNVDQKSMLVYSGGCSKIVSIDTETGEATDWLSINFSSWTLTKNRWLVYNTTSNVDTTKIMKVDLKVKDGVKTWVAGTGTTCGTVGALGTSATLTPLKCGSTVGVTPLVLSNSDATVVWVSSYSGGAAFQITFDPTLSDYVITKRSTAWNSIDIIQCKGNDFDSYVYCRNWSAGRQINVFDPINDVWLTDGVIPFANDDQNGFLAIGFSPSKLLTFYSLNDISVVTPMHGGTWIYTNVAGQPLSILGNNGPLSGVAFSQPVDIKYNINTQSLLVRNVTGHLRRIDFADNYKVSTIPWAPGSTDTGSSQPQLFVNLVGDRFSTFGQWGTWTRLTNYSLSTTATSYLSQFMQRGSAITNAYPPTNGANPQVDTGNVKGDYINGSRQNMVYHTNGKLYFAARNGSSDVLIFSSNTTSVNYIAGALGPGGYANTDHGLAALGSLLTNVQHLYEIPSGHTYAGDLLIVDGDRLRRVSITTESATPRLYDVLSLTSISGYTAGTTFNDFIYDFASETSGLGSGRIYYVTSSNVVRKVIGGLDSAYSFDGTSLSGFIRITLTPAGLLVLQPSKNRILRVAP